MMDKIKLIGLNYNIKWKDKEFNFNEIERRFSGTKADLFLLPEMFATGFCMEPHEIADRNMETLQWMQSFAKQNDAAVCGSASVMEDGKFYNRMYFVKPDGSFPSI
ncbi:hypothetical protein BPO_1553 [Bergeyella porcorum]|uniref:CN hydrolase domain-containing protein n=1 Tax=Bergeyella porcorum TaxID=1735111 RepID=A0AAU0F281_9FLAO